MERPMIETFSVNVARKVGRVGQYRHTCTIEVRSNDHNEMMAIMERLEVAFPIDDYSLTLYGVPYLTRYKIDPRDLTADGMGYPDKK